MATFDMSKSLQGFRLSNFLAIFSAPADPTLIGPVTLGATTSSGFDYKFGTGGAVDTMHYGVSGGTYSASGTPLAGTVTSLSFTEVVTTVGGTVNTNNILSVTGLSVSLADVYAAKTTTAVQALLLAGNDTIIGSAFNDEIDGGAGDDKIDGGSGNDVIYGGIGNDNLIGGAGDDILNGGEGNDTIDGGVGNDTLIGGAGDDTLIGGLGIDTVSYSNSLATGGVTVDLVAGQSWDKAGSTSFGHDTLAGVENVNGSAGDDWISGSNTANTLSGNLGADTIYGLGGDDFLYGGDGNDGLYGGDGNDWIESGTGVDYVEGGLGNDTLIDDSGTAVPHEWSALYGGAGNDKIEGRGFGDVGMWGGDGSDTLTFGAGKSFAYGGAGADTFQFGNDALIGSAGSSNLAQVYDYQLGVDHIHLNGTATVLNWGVNTGIDITNASGMHETIMLMGINSAQLQATGWII
jgi:Ca2+-binding RTX toxin-like protein